MSVIEHANEIRAAVGAYEAGLDALDAGVASIVVESATNEASRREKQALKALIATGADEPAELAAKFRVLAYLIEREIWEDLAVKLHRSASADFDDYHRAFIPAR